MSPDAHHMTQASTAESWLPASAVPTQRPCSRVQLSTSQSQLCSSGESDGRQVFTVVPHRTAPGDFFWLFCKRLRFACHFWRFPNALTCQHVVGVSWAKN